MPRQARRDGRGWTQGWTQVDAGVDAGMWTQGRFNRLKRLWKLLVDIVAKNVIIIMRYIMIYGDDSFCLAN